MSKIKDRLGEIFNGSRMHQINLVSSSVILVIIYMRVGFNFLSLTNWIILIIMISVILVCIYTYGINRFKILSKIPVLVLFTLVITSSSLLITKLFTNLFNFNVTDSLIFFQIIGFLLFIPKITKFTIKVYHKVYPSENDDNLDSFNSGLGESIKVAAITIIVIGYVLQMEAIQYFMYDFKLTW